jgi:hypothetical protein
VVVVVVEQVVVVDQVVAVLVVVVGRVAKVDTTMPVRGHTTTLGKIPSLRTKNIGRIKT